MWERDRERGKEIERQRKKDGERGERERQREGEGGEEGERGKDGETRAVLLKALWRSELK